MGGATSKLSQIENLYALQHHPEGDRFAAEREFFDRRIDGPASDAHRVLLNAGASELSPEQRDAWARFIVSIAARAPAAVEHARFGALQHFDEEPEEYDSLTFREFLERYVPGVFTDFPLQILANVIDDPAKAGKVARMHW